MLSLLRILVGVLLVGHGLVHLLYLVDDVPEFQLDHSWIVPHDASRPVAVALMAATVIGSMLLGLAVWGVPVLSGAWPALATATAATSLVLLVAFWDNHLVLGLVIDLVMVALAVLRPEWTHGIA